MTIIANALNESAGGQQQPHAAHTGAAPNPRPSLKSLFCERFHCPPELYPQQALRRTLHLRARLIAPLLSLCSRSFFAEDLQFLEQLGDSSNWLEAKAATQHFYLRNNQISGFWRIRMKMRVSGRKAGLLARDLLQRP